MVYPDGAARRDTEGRHINLHQTKGSESVPDEVYSQLLAEADPDGLLKQEEQFLELHVYPLTKAILAHPAATVDGLAVKARAFTFATRGRGHVWGAEAAEDLGWDEQVLRDLVDSLLRLAGVDRFGRPLASTA